MPKRMDTTPLLITSGHALRLTRIPLGDREFDESWLQDLLFRHPSLLPIDDIEPVFAPPIPVARELPTPSGPLDILYLTPTGYPTLVETKLWRNPEARRQVVAQAIDYAAQLSKWSYADLVAAVRRARSDLQVADPFAALMEAADEEWDQSRFVDAVSRNLRRGQMLLLIVGDGIHESVEDMADTLSRTPQLAFSLGLVEMALFRPPGQPETLFVQPRIVTRTRETVRAIVEIRGDVQPQDVQVTLPPSEEGERIRRRVLSDEEFFLRLAEETTPETASALRAFVSEAESLGVVPVAREKSMSLHYAEPANGARFSFGSVYVDARVDMFYVVYYFEAAGFDAQIGRDYLNEVAGLVPGARVDIWKTKSGSGSAVKVAGRHVTIQELLERRTDWLGAIERMIARINSATGAPASA